MSRRPRAFGRLLLRCYPPAWRRRYGDELLALLDDAGLNPRTAIDVAAAGIRQRAHSVRRALTGVFSMMTGPERHPTAYALVAALLLLPSLVLVTGSLLAYQLGVQPVRVALEPVLVTIGGWRVVDLWLQAAPLLAAAAALAPVVHLRLDRHDSAMRAVVTIRALALNLVVAMLALGVGGALVWYVVSEAVLEAGR